MSTLVSDEVLHKAMQDPKAFSQEELGRMLQQLYSSYDEMLDLQVDCDIERMEHFLGAQLAVHGKELEALRKAWDLEKLSLFHALAHADEMLRIERNVRRRKKLEETPMHDKAFDHIESVLEGSRTFAQSCLDNAARAERYRCAALLEKEGYPELAAKIKSREDT